MTAKIHAMPAAPAPEVTIPGVAALTEDTLALQFVADFGADYRHVPGWGWMRWNGTHWVRDAGLRHFDDARKIAREFGDVTGTAPAEARRIASAKTVASGAGRNVRSAAPPPTARNRARRGYGSVPFTSANDPPA